MRFIKILPVVTILILLKYVKIKLMKSRIRAYLGVMDVRNIIIKFEKMAYRHDIYCVAYELDGEVVEKHVVCDWFLGMRWL